MYGILKSVEVLFHKGLYEQAMRVFQKPEGLLEITNCLHRIGCNELEVELLSKMDSQRLLIEFKRQKKF